MPTLLQREAEIAYEVTGAGPAVVLGHSLLCDERMWTGVTPRLASRYRVINVCARGHGASTAPVPFTIEDLARDWIAILDREGIARAALCGLSLGGMTAMRVALAAPERVSALALLDTSADPEPLWSRAKYTLMAAAVRRAGAVEPIYRIAASVLLGRTTRRNNPAMFASEVQRMMALDIEGIDRALHAVVARRDISADIGAIRCPTLVLVGDEDEATPVLRAERIAARIPGAWLRILSGAGHLTALEQPDRVADHLLGFFERLSW